MLWRRMWVTEGCGGRRCAVATLNRESQKEKKKRRSSKDNSFILFSIIGKYIYNIFLPIDYLVLKSCHGLVVMSCDSHLRGCGSNPSKSHW